MLPGIAAERSHAFLLQQTLPNIVRQLSGSASCPLRHCTLCDTGSGHWSCCLCRHIHANNHHTQVLSMSSRPAVFASLHLFCITHTNMVSCQPPFPSRCLSPATSPGYPQCLPAGCQGAAMLTQQGCSCHSSFSVSQTSSTRAWLCSCSAAELVPSQMSVAACNLCPPCGRT